MQDLSQYSDYEFLRPLVSGWLGKVEAALGSKARRRWQELADECHDDQTEVLTDSGWKKFKDLTSDEMLGTVNLETDTIEFQKPTAITARQHSGEMFRFSGKSLDALVTPGHRMAYFPAHSSVPGLKEAKDILRSDQLKLTAANWQGKTPSLPECLNGISPEDFAEWLGFYVAEGWCSAEREAGDQSHRIFIAQVKESGREYYEKLIRRLPVCAAEYRPNQKCYGFSNKELWRYLKEVGTSCYTKCVPQWVKGSPQAIILAFLRGYVAGDGHVSADGQTVCLTASKTLADDIQELWLKVGRSASISERTPTPYMFREADGSTRSGNNNVGYLVIAWHAGKRASLKRHTEGEIRLKYQKEDYYGMVYCATVPNDTLITRRNGLPLISGNCMMFYSRSAAAMWDQDYGRKFWSGIKAPRFRISLNKAFEFVALYGPNLMWDVPYRTATPQKPLELPDLPPEFEQIRQQEFSQNRIVGSLMQGWLNYTPRETPGGGLETQNELAIIDGLVKGRGVLWPSVYRFDGSERTITGCFRKAPEDLILDPDFKTVQQAKWVCLRHLDTVDDLVARFPGLKREQFQGGRGLESNWHYGESKGKDDKGIADRKAGKSNDLVLWYEIWSKMGPGSRATGMPNEFKEHLETTVGRYAYICICPDCAYPLNLPKEWLLSGATDSDVRERLSWPIPWWKDDAWPMREMDFHLDPDGPYPIPPLAAALGELKFLNFLVPWLCNRIYSSSRDFWAVIGSHFDEYKKYLEDGEDQVVFPIPPGQYDDIKKAIQNLTQPETRADAWKIYELVNEAFDKRMGMTPMLYGLNPNDTQNRTAAETNTKWQALGVRQEQMQKKVVAWQGRLASAEAQLAWLFVTAKDTQPLLGQAGGMLWQKYIQGADPELIMRQMQYDISAASIRRPNRERDVANLQEFLARWMPVMQAYGSLTGDFTPLNGAAKKWGELHDMEMDGIYIPAKDPSDPQVAMQQQVQQAELGKSQAELQKLLAEAQKLTAEAQSNPLQVKMQELQLKSSFDQQKLAMDMEKSRLEAERKNSETMLKQQVEREKSARELEKARTETALKIQELQAKLDMQKQQAALDIAKAKQEMQSTEQMQSLKAEMDTRKAELDLQLKAATSAHDMAIKAHDAKLKAALATQDQQHSQTLADREMRLKKMESQGKASDDGVNIAKAVAVELRKAIASLPAPVVQMPKGRKKHTKVRRDGEGRIIETIQEERD